MNAQNSDETYRMIRCSSGGQFFWLDSAEISTVQQVASMRPPITDDGSVGFIPILSADVPVYRLSQLLGLEATIDSGSHVLVIETAAGAVGLLVEELSTITRIARNQIAALPKFLATDGRGCFVGAITAESEATAGGGLSLLLSAHRLVCDQDVHQGSYTDWVAAVAGTRPRGNTSAGQIVIFAAGESQDTLPSRFALSISQILEITERMPVVPVPQSPSFVEGIVNWRGCAVPIVDLPGMCGYETGSGGGAQRLLIARSTNGVPVGFYVHSAIQTHRLPLTSHPVPTPPELNTPHTKALFETDQGTLLIPQLDFATTA